MSESVKINSTSNLRFHGAEIYLILVLLVFGLGTCFLLPVGGGFDEETHLMRVWEMSAFTFLPNEKLGGEMPFPAVYWEMSYRRPFIVRAVEADFWENYKDLTLDAHDYIYGKVETRSVYAPPLLLPQALIMRFLGRRQQLPALTVFYICRLIGLFSFIGLAWLAVRVVPSGKWLLALLASSPVVVLQAATISADAISNGIAFLFIAASLALVNRSELRWREVMLFALLFLMLFWGKLNIIPLALLPFLLLRPEQFKMRFGYVALLAITVFLFVVEVLGWNLLAYSRLATAAERADPVGQIAFMLNNPIRFLGIFTNELLTRSLDYMRDWIAIYGYGYWPVPVGTFYLYGAALVTALMPRGNDQSLEKRTRTALIVIFVLSYLVTILSLYITFTPVGNAQVDGVQGRYFVTVMPLLFLALAGWPGWKRIQLPISVPVTLGITSLLFYGVGMYLSYHVPCGSQYYQPGLCYQPNYKNWSPDDLYSSPISSQLKLSQEIVPECNGMTELRVWVNASGSNADESTRFLVQSANDKMTVVDLYIPNSELPLGNWYSLNFAPDWNSDGKFYLLTIAGDDLTHDGPRIAYSLRPEYPAGKLFENEEAVGHDLIFQTGCIAGWAGR